MKNNHFEAKSAEMVVSKNVEIFIIKFDDLLIPHLYHPHLSKRRMFPLQHRHQLSLSLSQNRKEADLQANFPARSEPA